MLFFQFCSKYFIVNKILAYFGIFSTVNPGLESGSKLMFVIGLFFQLWGEEFYKIFILLIIMFAVYKFTSNRNLAIRIGIIATLIIFGLTHMTTYGNLWQVLLMQGLGSIFNLYAYMKTKNVVVSYIIHVLTDIFGSLGYILTA